MDSNPHDEFRAIGGKCAAPNCSFTVLFGSRFCSAHQSHATGSETLSSRPSSSSPGGSKYVARKSVNPFFPSRLSKNSNTPSRTDLQGPRSTEKQNLVPQVSQQVKPSQNDKHATSPSRERVKVKNVIPTGPDHERNSAASLGLKTQQPAPHLHPPIARKNPNPRPEDVPFEERTITVRVAGMSSSSSSANEASEDESKSRSTSRESFIIPQQARPIGVNESVHQSPKKPSRPIEPSRLSSNLVSPGLNPSGQADVVNAVESINSFKLPGKPSPEKLTESPMPETSQKETPIIKPAAELEAVDKIQNTRKRKLDTLGHSSTEKIMPSTKRPPPTPSHIAHLRQHHEKGVVQAKSPRVTRQTRKADERNTTKNSKLPESSFSSPVKVHSINVAVDDDARSTGAQHPTETKSISLVNRVTPPLRAETEARRLKRIARFDSDAFDAAFYQQPGSHIPDGLEMPTRAVQEATDRNKDSRVAVFGHPTILGMHKRSESWIRRKIEEIERRPSRKKWFGKVAERERWLQTKYAQEEADRKRLHASNQYPPRQVPPPHGYRRVLDFGDIPEDELPEDVRNNKAWLRSCAWHRHSRRKAIQRQRELKRRTEETRLYFMEVLRGHQSSSLKKSHQTSAAKR